MKKILDMNMPEYSEEVKEIIRCKKLCFRINGLEPGSGQISVLQKELFNGGLPKGAALMPLQQMDRANCITIGEKVFINHSFVTVAIGGIRIDDEVMVALCVKILTPIMILWTVIRFMLNPFISNAMSGLGLVQRYARESLPMRIQ